MGYLQEEIKNNMKDEVGVLSYACNFFVKSSHL